MFTERGEKVGVWLHVVLEEGRGGERRGCVSEKRRGVCVGRGV